MSDENHELLLLLADWVNAALDARRPNAGEILDCIQGAMNDIDATKDKQQVAALKSAFCTYCEHQHALAKMEEIKALCQQHREMPAPPEDFAKIEASHRECARIARHELSAQLRHFKTYIDD